MTAEVVKHYDGVGSIHEQHGVVELQGCHLMVNVAVIV